MYINSLFKQYHLNLIQIIIINNKINNARSSLCLIGFQVVKILLFSGMPFGSYFVCHFQFIWKYRKITMFCYYGTDAIVDVHETTVLYSPWNSFSLSVNLTLIDTYYTSRLQIFSLSPWVIVIVSMIAYVVGTNDAFNKSFVITTAWNHQCQVVAWKLIMSHSSYNIYRSHDMYFSKLC
jgi:hypothetical protein